MEHDLSERNMVIERNNHEMEIIFIRSEGERKRYNCWLTLQVIFTVSYNTYTPACNDINKQIAQSTFPASIFILLMCLYVTSEWPRNTPKWFPS